MRWKLRKRKDSWPRRRFAVIPVFCHDIEEVVWLESYWAGNSELVGIDESFTPRWKNKPKAGDLFYEV